MNDYSKWQRLSTNKLKVREWKRVWDSLRMNIMDVPAGVQVVAAVGCTYDIWILPGLSLQTMTAEDWIPIWGQALTRLHTKHTGENNDK